MRALTGGAEAGFKRRKAGNAAGLHRRESGSRRWDSNPRPAVYETAALPLSYAGEASCTKLLRGGRACVQRGSVYCGGGAIVKQLRWAEATSSSSREAVPRGSSERRWGGRWGAIRRNRRSTPPFRELERKALPPAGDMIFIKSSRRAMLMKMC